MIINHYQLDTEDALTTKLFEEGALYFIKDTKRIYLDPVGGSSRILIGSDPIIIETEDALYDILAPIPGKLYFVLENSTSYVYHNGLWYANKGNSQKAGIIYINSSNTLPEGFLWCDGASYSRTDYPELFAVIGSIYGSADSTHFNVPDFRMRVPVGSGDGYDLGDTGGENIINILNMGEDESNSTDSGSNKYTVVNYIISTGKGNSVSANTIISGIQSIPLNVQYGGTGATSAEEALANLGGASKEYVDNAIASASAEYPTLTEHLASEAMVLSNLQYGTELPQSAVEGQLFFKIIT